MEKFPKLKEKVRLVIFCGGFGTRIWPMSRETLPKQFQPLLGEQSFFRDTLGRVLLSFAPQDIYLSLPQSQVKFAQKQAPNIPEANIIAEPERRDTLGAIGFVTTWLDQKFPGSLMAVTWSDHFVRDKKQYARAFKVAARVCQVKKVICKIDVKPPYPAGQLGWVKVGKKIGQVDGYAVHQFLAFVEKPGKEKAEKLFAQKDFLINTGYYVWRTTTMLGYFQKHAPDCYQHLVKIKQALGTNQAEEKVAQHYRQIEKNSVDYGIFEKLKTGDMVVIPVDLGWHDVGTWDLIYETLARGQRENVVQGDVYFREAKGNLVYLPKKKIAALIGVENLVVVDTPDGLLVCQRSRAGEVKKFVNYLKEKKKNQYL